MRVTVSYSKGNRSSNKGNMNEKCMRVRADCMIGGRYGGELYRIKRQVARIVDILG